MALSSEKVTDESTNVGYGLIGAYVLVYVGMAVSISKPDPLIQKGFH